MRSAETAPVDDRSARTDQGPVEVRSAGEAIEHQPRIGGEVEGIGDAVARPREAAGHGFPDRQRRLAVGNPRQQEAVIEGSAVRIAALDRSEEHTSELQSLMRISYAVFCLKQKKTQT